MKIRSASLMFGGLASLATAQFGFSQTPESSSKQAAPATRSILARDYHEGEKLVYEMKGINENWRYEIQASGVVTKDAAGNFYEEYAWSNLVSDGTSISLPPTSVNYRQRLTLDLNAMPSFPDLSRVDTRLIGPITDMLTFYSDLWLAKRIGKLVRAGDHFYFKRSVPNSWADGNYVALGEDSIDFDMTLTEINESEKIATLLVRHVPPEKPEVRLPVEWMRSPVADTPNNWVEVKKRDGKYVAAVGKETFDVQIKVSLADGKILSAALDNPVITIERECTDAALTNCGDPRRHPIRRQIEIHLEP